MDAAPCAACAGAPEALLRGDAEQALPQLAGVFDAIVISRAPRSTLNRLRNGAGADVAAGGLALTHEVLDVHPRAHAADYLPHVLVANAALPGVAPHRALDRRRGRRSRPTADRPLVKAYATRRVL